MESGHKNCSQLIFKKSYSYIYFNVLWLITCALTCMKSIKGFRPVCTVFLQFCFSNAAHSSMRMTNFTHSLGYFTNAACCRATPLQLPKQGPDFVTVPMTLALLKEGLFPCLWEAVEPVVFQAGQRTSAQPSALPAETCSSPFKKTWFFCKAQRGMNYRRVFCCCSLISGAVLTPSSSSALCDSHGSLCDRPSPGSGFTLCRICAQL